MDRGPIFLAGLDRSGIGFLCELLESHPHIAMTRRTNFWAYFFNRYGDLSNPENFERCLAAMMRFTRIQALQPQPERLRREFFQGEASYARLFALVQEQNARRLGKLRWGDKSLNSEQYADTILAAYPTARFVHVIRDPRDRHASAMTHRGIGKGKTAAGTAIWLWSVRLAGRNLQRYSGRYKVVCYEALVTRPEATLREICDFVGEEYAPAMLMMNGCGDPSNKGCTDANSRQKPRHIWTTSIGRFRGVLTEREIAFIQMCARKEMAHYQYPLEPIHFSPASSLRFFLADYPVNLARMLAWQGLKTIRDWNGRNPSARKLIQRPELLD